MKQTNGIMVLLRKENDEWHEIERSEGLLRFHMREFDNLLQNAAIDSETGKRKVVLNLNEMDDHALRDMMHVARNPHMHRALRDVIDCRRRGIASEEDLRIEVFLSEETA